MRVQKPIWKSIEKSVYADSKKRRHKELKPFQNLKNILVKFLLKNLHKNQALCDLSLKIHRGLIRIKHSLGKRISLSILTLESQDNPNSCLNFESKLILDSMLFDYKRLTEELEYNGVILTC